MIHNIRNKLTEVLHKISQVKQQNIKLVAVSKNHSFVSINKLYNLGVRDFGESYAQEFILKKQQAEKNKLTDICWHFIGAIQSNKLKIIQQADIIHSVCRLDHAKKLNNLVKESKKKILLQVNFDKNSHRQGVEAKNIINLAQEILKLDKLKLIGLMTILPQDNLEPEYYFGVMFELKLLLEKKFDIKNCELSMGMSNDFIAAIKSGATMVRIGSQIFGPR